MCGCFSSHTYDDNPIVRSFLHIMYLRKSGEGRWIATDTPESDLPGYINIMAEHQSIGSAIVAYLSHNFYIVNIL